jgi:hypothetical protein
MAHPRKPAILVTLKLFQPAHSTDTDYTTKYNSILGLVVDKVVTDVQAVINTDVEDFPEELDNTIAFMASDFIGSFGLINTDEEQAGANDGVSSITEGDVSVSFSGTSKAASLAEALQANSITGNYASTIRNWRKVQW